MWFVMNSIDSNHILESEPVIMFGNIRVLRLCSRDCGSIWHAVNLVCKSKDNLQSQVTSISLSILAPNKHVLMQYIKHKRQCFIGISKHWEESWKYNMQPGIFDEIRGVWIADETLSQVFDISSQSKQKRKGKRKSKFVKI